MEVILIADSVILNLRKVGKKFTPSLSSRRLSDTIFFSVNTEISSEKQYSAVEKEYSSIPRRDQLTDKLENIYKLPVIY